MMERYSRQILLPEIGEEGQARLARARCFVVGAGGLGSPLLLSLVAAGVGNVAIADDDRVSLSNLNRQTLYTEADLGQPKAECAAQRLRAMNSQVAITSITERVTAENAAALLRGYDVVIDCSDNIATRYILDDTAREVGIPYIYAAIDGFVGQVAIFNHGPAPRHLRDLWPEMTDNTPVQAQPALGAVAAVVGAVEAHEAIKIICGYGSPLSSQLWRIDMLTMQSHTLTL